MLSLKPGHPGSPDMAARRKGIRVLISVCRSFEERMECRMPLVLFDWIITQLRGITPRELLSVFPPTKTYDGERYQCKDYFTTMEAVHKHGLDVPLGDRTFEFLYDYLNPHVSNFVVRYMCAISDARRKEGKPGLLEEFLQEKGVASYSKIMAPDGREVMVNNQTGAMYVVAQPKRKMPRWWKVIRGGAETQQTNM